MTEAETQTDRHNDYNVLHVSRGVGSYKEANNYVTNVTKPDVHNLSANKAHTLCHSVLFTPHLLYCYIQLAQQQLRQAGWFLRPDCAPVPNASSSWICGQNPRNDADAHFWMRTSLSSTAAARRHAASTAAARYDRRRLSECQTSKCISSVSFV